LTYQKNILMNNGSIINERQNSMFDYTTEVRVPVSMKDHVIAAFGHARFPAGEGAKPTEWNSKILIDATEVSGDTVHVKVKSDDDSQRQFVCKAFKDAGLGSRSVGSTIIVNNTPNVPVMKIER
jgi:hypothetical protein